MSSSSIQANSMGPILPPEASNAPPPQEIDFDTGVRAHKTVFDTSTVGERDADRYDPSEGEQEPEQSAADQTPTEDNSASEDASEDASDAPVTQEDINTSITEQMNGDVGTDAGNALQSMIKRNGLEMGEIQTLFYDAMDTADASKLDRSAIEARFGSDEAPFVYDYAKRAIADHHAQVRTMTRQCQDIVGGEATFTAICDHVNSKGTKAEQAAFQSAIQAGGNSMKEALLNAKAAMRSGGKTKLVDPQTKPLSRAEYSRECEKVYESRKLSPAEKRAALDVLARRRGIA